MTSSDDEAPEVVTRPAAQAQAAAAASGEAAQRSLARAAAKARRAGRFGQLQPEAPGQLERLPDSVVAALALRCGGCRRSPLRLAPAQAHSRLLHSRRSQRGDSDADEEEEEAQPRRRAKRRALREGESLRVGERLTVTVLSDTAMPSASVPEAAVAFVRAKLVTRHRRSRGIDAARGIPYDFAHPA